MGRRTHEPPAPAGTERRILPVALAFFFTLALLAPLTHDRVFTGGNDAARWAHIESLVDHGRASIERSRYAWTVDQVVIDGKPYANKPPLPGIVGAAVYGALRTVLGLSFETAEARTVYVLTLLLVGVPTAALVAGFWGALAMHREIPLGSRLYSTAALAAGTILTSYSVTLNNHTVAAALLFAATVAAWRGRGLLAGACAGLVLSIDIVPGLVFLPALALGLYERRDRRLLVRYLAAATVGILLFVGANWVTVGSPLPPKMAPGAVDRSPGANAGSGPAGGAVRVNVPLGPPASWTHPLRCLFGWHGLFTVSPVLLLAAWGTIRAARDGSPLPRRWPRTLGAASLVLFAGHVLLVRSFGGWSYGYRYMIPALPVLLFFLPRAVERAPRWLLGAVLAASVALALLGSYHPWPPVWQPEAVERHAAARVHNPVGANLAAWLNEYFPDLPLSRRVASRLVSPERGVRDPYLYYFYRSKGDEEAARAWSARARSATTGSR